MKRVFAFVSTSEKSHKFHRHECNSYSLFSPLHIYSLPKEILFHIFSFLEFFDLSNVALASRSSRSKVEIYISSPACVQLSSFRNPHLLTPPANSSEVKHKLKYYERIGHLFRRLYCSISLSSRIDFLQDILRAHMCSEVSLGKSVSYEKKRTSFYCLFDRRHCTLGQLRCPSLFFFGHFLRSFLSGCSDYEQQRVFHSLVHSCFGQNFWLRLTNLICTKPGECPDEELMVRLFLRRVFLDPLGLPVVARPSWSDIPARLSESTLLCRHTDCNSLPSCILSEFRPEDVIENTSNSSNLFLNETSYSTNEDTGSFFLSNPATTSRSHQPSLITSTPVILSGNPSCSKASREPIAWPTATAVTNILRSYPFVHQARLLFILYGPVHKGKLMWRIMCENTAADVKQLSACFGEIGCVLNSMWTLGKWTSDDTLAVLQEVTSIPDGWLAENIACLLHSSGPQLASLVVKQKASRGRVAELAVILTSLCLVHVKIKEDLTGLLRLVGDAVQATGTVHRQGFLDALAYAFRGVIVDLYETDELDERIEDFSIILKAQSYFFRALLARVYED